ncbi:MAG: hypothetical protein JXL97_15110 [Bacteroidales bacterium]|nr:hypothetical protein [Bacteroidales bacterium]
MPRYKVYITERIEIKDWLKILFYLLLNTIPFFLINEDLHSVFILLISFVSLSIFMGSDYLKLTRNIYLYLSWFILYLIIYFFQKDLIDNSFINNTEMSLKMIRFPIIGIVYSQVFRIAFVLKYKYEPSLYWIEDRIGRAFVNKNIKNREDYIWFFIGRLMMLVVIIFLNLYL